MIDQGGASTEHAQSFGAWSTGTTFSSFMGYPATYLPKAFFDPLKMLDGTDLPANQFAKISVLELGGTIASVSSPDGKVPALSFGDLLKRIDSTIVWPELYVATPGSRRFHFGNPLDSSVIGFPDIMRAVDRLYHHTAVSESVIVTCGTDRLADIAKLCSLMLRRPPCPIIFTGSQRTIQDEESDVARNLRDSLFLTDKLDPGVYIVFGGRILNAIDAFKFSTENIDAFRSASSKGDLGSVDAAANRYQIHEDRYEMTSDMRVWLKRYGRLEYVTFCDYDHDPRVESMDLTVGGRTTGMETLLKSPEVSGLVVKIPGSGGISKVQATRLSQAAEYETPEGKKYKPIVLATRCPHGPTDLNIYAAGSGVHDLPGIVPAGVISSESAALFLQWNLAGTTDIGKLREIFMNPSRIPDAQSCDRSVFYGNHAGEVRNTWHTNPFRKKLVQYGYGEEHDQTLRLFD